MVAVWPVLVFFLVFVLLIAAVVSVMTPQVRARAGWTAAAIVAAIVLYIVVYVAVDLARSLADIDRARQATERIASSEVQVDGLRLTGTSAPGYRMTGLVRNLSPTYTLTDVRFDLVVLDCVKGECREQGRGHVEVIRRVPPNQSSTFDTSIVSLPPMLAPLGERRFTTRVYLTYAAP